MVLSKEEVAAIVAKQEAVLTNRLQEVGPSNAEFMSLAWSHEDLRFQLTAAQSEITKLREALEAIASIGHDWEVMKAREALGRADEAK